MLSIPKKEAHSINVNVDEIIQIQENDVQNALKQIINRLSELISK